MFNLGFVVVWNVCLEAIEILSGVNDIRDKRDRRAAIHHPAVRVKNIICHELGIYRMKSELTLTENFCLSLIRNNQVIKPGLDKIKERLIKHHETTTYEQQLIKDYNIGNQHPEFLPDPLPTTAEGVRQELSFRDSEEYLETGKTYAWTLFDGYPEELPLRVDNDEPWVLDEDWDLEIDLELLEILEY